MKKKYILYITLLQFAILINCNSPVYAQSSLKDRLKQHVFTLAADSLMGRKAGSEHTRMAANYITTQWEEIGISPLAGNSYYMPFMQNKYHNLAGIIEGNDPLLKYEYIIVGAHYDHLGSEIENGKKIIYNGADDNASGVAAIIELGRNLKEMQPSLRRSVVIIAFDAEEIGLYGSNEFAANPPFPIEQIKLMISIDMVGWFHASGFIRYSGAATIKNGKRLLSNESFIPEGLRVKTQRFEKSILTATDTRGFAKSGIPTFAVTTGLKSPYHKPEDMAHLIDYDGMALITEHLTNVVVAASHDDSFRASGKVSPIHQTRPKRFTIGIATNTGANYHYYTGGAIDGKSKISGGIGLSARIHAKHFWIRPEVYYDFTNAKHPQGDISTQGITAPLNVSVMLTASENDPFSVGPFIGVYYSYKFNGQQNNAKLDFVNLYHREEMGLNIGFEIRIINTRFGYTQRRAFTNFTQTKNADGAHIRNRASFFSLGYFF